MKYGYYIEPSFESIQKTSNFIDDGISKEQLEMFGKIFLASEVKKNKKLDSKIELIDSYTINDKYTFAYNSVKECRLLEIGDVIEDKDTGKYLKVFRADAYSFSYVPVEDFESEDFQESEELHQTVWSERYNYIEKDDGNIILNNPADKKAKTVDVINFQEHFIIGTKYLNLDSLNISVVVFNTKDYAFLKSETTGMVVMIDENDYHNYINLVSLYENPKYSIRTAMINNNDHIFVKTKSDVLKIKDQWEFLMIKNVMEAAGITEDSKDFQKYKDTLNTIFEIEEFAVPEPSEK